MNWRHVQLIYHREMRDQLRDRRTLFTITILPLLLYPLLGMLMMQVAQFKREQTVHVRIVGLEYWPATIPLVRRGGPDNDRLVFDAVDSPNAASQTFEIELTQWPDSGASPSEIVTRLRDSLGEHAADVLLVVEPTFATRLSQRAAAASLKDNATNANSPPPADTADASSPSGLTVIANLARDRSQLGLARLKSRLDAWHQRWIAAQLAEVGIDPALVAPIPFDQLDTSDKSIRSAILWSKVLPFVMLIWALTGAFYPAIDLCAGEKERGTLETLLSSPARRREIVWGKLLTVATFSVLSALLNIVSMYATTGFIVEQLSRQGAGEMAAVFGRLPVHAFGWLLLLLVPMAAFFSATALAVAALARSTKEGQYYLMPLMLFALPLVALPMIPDLELSLATSLVPVSGAILVVRAFIEGRLLDGFMYLPFVVFVTSLCCLLAIRWAVRQFESEAVMFSEVERWNLQTWLKQVWRERGSHASPTEAVLCGVIILVATFFAQFVISSGELTWDAMAGQVFTTQLGLILGPALLMAVVLTRSLRQALRLHRVPLIQLLAALVLGVALHPSYMLLAEAIRGIVKIGPETLAVLEQVSTIINAQELWAILLVLALVPAVCEELTYRGFIFGGLLRNNGVLRAILVSSVFFGLAHSFLQQSIAATLMGLLLGIIAWRTGSVLCTMLIHVVNNTLSLSLSWLSARELTPGTGWEWMIRVDNGQWSYQPQWVTLSIVIAGLMLVVLWRRSPATARLVQTELA
jgi:sodium transport system permease protein